MGARFSVDTKQLEGLYKRIKEAQAVFGANKLSQVFLKGARVIQKEAKRTAPVGKYFSEKGKWRKHGLLKKSIVANAYTSGRGQANKVGYAKVRIHGRKAPHGHLVELGTAARYRKGRKGAEISRVALRGGGFKVTRAIGKRFSHAQGYTGFMKPNPFFERATRSKEGAVLDTISRELEKLWMKELQKRRVI